MPPEPSAVSAPFELIPAAQYIRASTEQQRYSAEYQTAAIAEYAEARGISVVVSYRDEGKSGLVLDGRVGLQQLLSEVVAGSPGFRIILVYDISRWGRFQDIDESAHYEFICRQAGIDVHYCDEPFDNDGSATTAIFKALKRAAAADFSRSLSARVYRGSRLSASKGFRHGPAPYGLRRMLIDLNGQPRCLLQHGERKYLLTDRVVLVPGPERERDVVRDVFRWFVEDGVDVIAIANRLTAEKIPGGSGEIWGQSTVRSMLRNEIYIGEQVYGKTTQKMHSKPRRTPPSSWVRRENACEPIVDRATFERAQAILRAPVRYLPNEEILARLKALYAREGRISEHAIRNDPTLPCGPTIRKRLGDTERLHALVGSAAPRSSRCARVTRLMRRLEDEAMDGALTVSPEIERLQAAAGQPTMLIRGTVSVRIYAAHPFLRPAGDWSWTCALSMAARGDWNLIIRCDPDREIAWDYLLLPRWGYRIGHAVFPPELPPEFQERRFDTVAAAIAELPSLRRLPPPDKFCRGPSRYLALRDYLRSIGDETITVSLPEIEQIIGWSLPRLVNTLSWWSNGRNPKTRTPQARAWIAAGYRGYLRPKEGGALFRRMTEQERLMMAVSENRVS